MAVRSLIVVASLWIVAVAYVAGLTWPVFPLDMPADDAQVRAAYNSAVSAHLLRYALMALIPGVGLVGAAWVISRRKRAAR